MKPRDPYRIFFPLGLLLGFIGVSIWPLFYFGMLAGYWGAAHAFIQADGFLFCFVAGFLLTALPRFTGTSVPSMTSQWTLAALVAIGSVAIEFQQYGIGQSVYFLAYALLATLAIRRFIGRKSAPPETFSLIGAAIVTGLVGAAINALVSWGVVGGGWGLAGKRALTEGMTLLLVLGVGGFLGPRLLGFERLPVVQIAGVEQLPSRRLLPKSSRTLYLIAGIIVVLSIFLEYGCNLDWMGVLRAAIATAVMFATLEPWKLPQVRTTLSWCVWISNILTLVGLWLASLFPIYRVDFLHILYIGGFSLLILAVGTRVTLSHGGHGLSREQKNWYLRLSLWTTLVAMLARVGAVFSPASYAMHLELAAIIWMLGLGLWGWGILRLIFSRTTH